MCKVAIIIIIIIIKNVKIRMTLCENAAEVVCTRQLNNLCVISIVNIVASWSAKQTDKQTEIGFSNFRYVDIDVINI